MSAFDRPNLLPRALLDAPDRERHRIGAEWRHRVAAEGAGLLGPALTHTVAAVLANPAARSDALLIVADALLEGAHEEGTAGRFALQNALKHVAGLLADEARARAS